MLIGRRTRGHGVEGAEPVMRWGVWSAYVGGRRGTRLRGEGGKRGTWHVG